MGALYGPEDRYREELSRTASRINSRNSSISWESQRSADFVYTFLRRKRDVDGVKDAELDSWIAQFEADKKEAALGFWYETHKGIQESLREF